MSGILLSRRSKLGAGAAAGPLDFITGQTLGALRNNYGDSLGFKFTVGAAPITVSHLARWVVSGNSAAHTVGIWSNPTGSPLDSVSVPTSGEPVGFKYVALGTPLVLAASTTYWIGSAEVSSGDQWYDTDTTVTHTAVASVVGSVYRAGVAGWQDASAGDFTFVLVNFKYTL